MAGWGNHADRAEYSSLNLARSLVCIPVWRSPFEMHIFCSVWNSVRGIHDCSGSQMYILKIETFVQPTHRYI